MADFTGADLRGARFERADLTGTQFIAADLADAMFRGVDMNGVVMRGVELGNVDITGEVENLTIRRRGRSADRRGTQQAVSRPGQDAAAGLLRRDRMSTVREVIDGLTDMSLDRRTEPVEGPGWPWLYAYLVRQCLLVVLNEEREHRLCAERDLGVPVGGSPLR